jgi:hypothetical protein
MHIHQNGWVVLLRQIGRPQAHENQQGGPGPRSDARRRNGGPPRKEVAGAENEPSLRNEGADHQPEPSVGRSSIIVYSQKMIVTNDSIDDLRGEKKWFEDGSTTKTESQNSLEIPK